MTPVDAPEAPATRIADPNSEVVRLFGDHGPSLYRFCHSMLGPGDDAEDVVQESFLRLLQHLQASGDRANLRAWLFTVAANGCRDRLRRRKRWVPWLPELDRRTSEPDSAKRDIDGAWTVLRDLAPRDRLLLSLRAQGLSYADMARAADIRPASVGRLLARAVDRWKKKVGA